MLDELLQDTKLTDWLQALAAIIAAYLVVSQNKEIKDLLNSLRSLAQTDADRLAMEQDRLRVESRPYFEVSQRSGSGDRETWVRLKNSGKTAVGIAVIPLPETDMLGYISKLVTKHETKHGDLASIFVRQRPGKAADLAFAISYYDEHRHHYSQLLQYEIERNRWSISSPVFLGRHAALPKSRGGEVNVDVRVETT